MPTDTELSETPSDRRKAVVNALCGPLGTDLASAYLNDAEFKAWVDGRVTDLLVLTEVMLAESKSRREAYLAALKLAETTPSLSAVLADLPSEV